MDHKNVLPLGALESVLYTEGPLTLGGARGTHLVSDEGVNEIVVWTENNVSFFLDTT